VKVTERKIIELQLDREINNFLKVVRYCPFDYPAVVLVNPYKDNLPAPTIYWLTCPYLNYEIDRLESESNLIDYLGEALKKDDEFRVKMKSAHSKYAEERRKLLSDKQLRQAEEVSEDLFKTLKFSGVGGIKDFKGIKCLHTHLADYLAGADNPAGEIVFSKVDWPENCKICSERVDEFESSSN